MSLAWSEESALLVAGVPSVVAENQIVQIRATQIPFQGHHDAPPFVMVNITLAYFSQKCKFKLQSAHRIYKKDKIQAVYVWIVYNKAGGLLIKTEASGSATCRIRRCPSRMRFLFCDAGKPRGQRLRQQAEETLA